MVPKGSLFLHRQMLTMRNQVAAHTDGNPVNHGEGGLPANNVRVNIREDEKDSLSIYELKFSPRGVRDIRALAEVLIGKTTYHVDRLWLKMARMIPGIPGDYLMDLPSETFRKIQASGEY